MAGTGGFWTPILTFMLRGILSLSLAVGVFLILVFGMLGVVARTVGDMLGLHQNSYEVVGTHSMVTSL
jgi:hypothetical protein